MQRYYLVFSLIVTFQTISMGQSKRGNIGILGTGVVLDFNFSPPSVYPTPEIIEPYFDTLEGSASISDNEGNLIFYTDGSIVWNKDHAPMPNGIGLHGFDFSTTLTQTIIVPIPKDPFQYYIITPGIQGKEMVYSLLDMRLDKGKGDIIFKNRLLYQKSTEKIALVKNASNESLWLITHEYGTNNFRTFLIDEDGLHMDYIVSSTGQVHKENTQFVDPNFVYGTNAIGYLKPSHDGNFLACAVSGEMGTVELFRFGKATGIVSEFVELLNDNIQGSYGVEFSSNNSKLYASCNPSRNLYQFDLASGNPAVIAASKKLISTNVSDALQLGPDNKIYCVPQANSSSLSRINDPNNLGVSCNYEQQAIDLGSETVWEGLPQLIYNTIDPEIIYEGFCIGSSTTFNLINIKSFKSIEWDFGDPDSGLQNTSTSVSPSHTYKTSGYFKLKVEITFLDNSIFNYSQRIFLFSLPKLSLGNDTIICEFNNLTLQPEIDNIPLEIEWSDGSTESSLSVLSSGEYWAEVNNGVCSSSDTILVDVILFPEVNLQDTTLCAEQFLSISLPTAFQYTWSDGNTDPERILNSAGEFSVIGKNYCGVRTAKLNLSFIPELVVNFPNDTLLCFGQTLHLDVQNEVAEYRWQDNSIESSYTISKDGEYSVEVYNRCETKLDTIQVGHVSETNYFIPNIITPNGDGLNDYFVIDEKLAPSNVSIINRLGDLIYSSNNYNDQWNGENFSSAMYYYIITDSCTRKEIKGWLSLAR